MGGVAVGKTMVVTGSASGIGKATTELFRRRGHRVIGVDRRKGDHGDDIVADLGTPAGRAEMIKAIEAACPSGIDAVVASAAIASVPEPQATIAINFFGAVATLEGLRPLLARSKSPRAVTFCSTAVMLPIVDESLVHDLLEKDEATVLAELKADENVCYASGKVALGRWLRRTAVTKEWAGSGILLNAIAPGVVKTPMNDIVFASEQGRKMLKDFQPQAVGRFGEAEEIAEAAGFLAELEGGYLLGQILYVDGGTDAILRPDLV